MRWSLRRRLYRSPSVFTEYSSGCAQKKTLHVEGPRSDSGSNEKFNRISTSTIQPAEENSLILFEHIENDADASESFSLITVSDIVSLCETHGLLLHGVKMLTRKQLQLSLKIIAQNIDAFNMLLSLSGIKLTIRLKPANVCTSNLCEIVEYPSANSMVLAHNNFKIVGEAVSAFLPVLHQHLLIDNGENSALPIIQVKRQLENRFVIKGNNFITYLNLFSRYWPSISIANHLC